MSEFFEEVIYRVYTKGIRRLIPTYQGRTIFTKFFWRTWWDRRRKGFDETCTWNLDCHLARLITPRLRMFINHKSGTPGNYVIKITDEMIANGKKYNTYKHRFVNKKDEDYLYKQAEKLWQADLEAMYDAFQDIVDEADSYTKWSAKYQKQIDMANKHIINKLSTEKERKEYWDSFGFDREYFAGIVFDAMDFSGKVREKGLTLFAKYFQHLWW